MEEPLWRSRRLSSWSLAAQCDAPVKRIGPGSLPERNPTVDRGCVELSCTHAEIGGGIVLSDYAAVTWPDRLRRASPPRSALTLGVRSHPSTHSPCHLALWLRNQRDGGKARLRPPSHFVVAERQHPGIRGAPPEKLQ